MIPAWLTPQVGKLIGLAAAAALIGGIILVQHMRINTLMARNAELRVQLLTLKQANDHQAAVIDQVTHDKETFARKAAIAEAELTQRRTTESARTTTAIKRITDHATPADQAPVSPALRDALGLVQQ